MTLEDRIVEAAKGWIGTPYKHAGRNRFGMDCAGLILVVMNQVGISDFDTKNYPKRPVPADFVREMKNRMWQIPNERLDHGNVGMFYAPSSPCHTGIIEREHDTLYLIHAYAGARKIVREPLALRLPSLFMAFSFTEPTP